MRLNWKVITSLIVTGFWVAVLFAVEGQPQSAQSSQTKQKPSRGETIEEADVSQFPIVDVVAEKGLAGKERAKWEAKGKKYNSSYAPTLNEFSNQVFSFIDWERGLPAFPFHKSSSVIIGEITRAEAHLSSDETKIYSEFTVLVDVVLKDDELVALRPQSKITVERPGGRVRFPSGKIVVAAVSNQDLPRVGRRYVLFLTHDFIMGGRYDETFFILTGYELRNSKVFPLDKLTSGHPINVYKGSDEEAFLKALTSALSNAFLPPQSQQRPVIQ
jgi:hypothetical protein